MRKETKDKILAINKLHHFNLSIKIVFVLSSRTIVLSLH
jgi:hypothetical protein